MHKHYAAGASAGSLRQALLFRLPIRLAFLLLRGPNWEYPHEPLTRFMQPTAGVRDTAQKTAMNRQFPVWLEQCEWLPGLTALRSKTALRPFPGGEPQPFQPLCTTPAT